VNSACAPLSLKRIKSFYSPSLAGFTPDTTALRAKFTGTEAYERRQMAKVSESSPWNVTCSRLTQPSTT
jgi:hypothetical protein